MKTMLFNPYTGKPRDPRDIASDPAGVLMPDPDEPLLATRASSSAQAVGADAARYRYIVDNNIILSGGGWPIAPFGRKDCDRYIDARLAQAKGENNG